jgi:hypothetical protein
MATAIKNIKGRQILRQEILLKKLDKKFVQLEIIKATEQKIM